MSVLTFPRGEGKTLHESEGEKARRIKAIIEEESEKGIKALETAWGSIQGKSFQETLLEIVTAMDEAGATLKEQEDTIKKYIAFVTALGERHGQRREDDGSQKIESSQ